MITLKTGGSVLKLVQVAWPLEITSLFTEPPAKIDDKI